MEQPTGAGESRGGWQKPRGNCWNAEISSPMPKHHEPRQDLHLQLKRMGL
jgi:hypothetical protein